MFRQLIHRIGHRGSFLLFLALLDLLYGYSILADPGALAAFHLIIPAETWGVAWVVVGLILLTGVATRYDKVHFGVSAAFKAAWATAMVNVWITQDFPRIWVDVVIWLAFSALVVVVSSWPELHRRPPEAGGKSDE